MISFYAYTHEYYSYYKYKQVPIIPILTMLRNRILRFTHAERTTKKGPQNVNLWSGRRGSNPRPSAWKADALPTELLPQTFQNKSPILLVSGLCGRRWIRTTEGINQQIYSLPHLATLVFSQNSFRTLSRWRESNPRPRDYKSRALAN